jgi:hypothetical protein
MAPSSSAADSFTSAVVPDLRRFGQVCAIREGKLSQVESARCGQPRTDAGRVGPDIIPHAVTVQQAATSSKTLVFLLTGIGMPVPVMPSTTATSTWCSAARCREVTVTRPDRERGAARIVAAACRDAESSAIRKGRAVHGDDPFRPTASVAMTDSRRPDSGAKPRRGRPWAPCHSPWKNERAFTPSDRFL